MRDRLSFRGSKRFPRVCHGTNVRRRRAAATAENAYAEGRGFTSEQSEIFRGRFRINNAVTFALGKASVGHAADTEIIDSSELPQDRQKRLRTQSAVRADHLDVFTFQLRRGARRANIAVRGAFF